MMRTLCLAVFSAALCACPAPSAPCDGGACTPTPMVTSSCDAGSYQDARGRCQPAGPAACAEGFSPDPSGWGCTATLETCDAGAMSVPGEGCTPVGWTQCPSGFERSADGWSCAPVLPATACTGATRAALGSATCTPVGDCSAAFPPAGATLFVDGAGPSDATHFTTVAAALAAAPAGATISVAAGTYRESLVFSKAVKVVGRCAASVQLVGSPALAVSGVTGVEVEGVTVRDSLLAARVEMGGGLTLRHAVLEANLRSGVQALDANTHVTLEDVVVRGTLPDPSTHTFGQGVAASFAAQLSLTDVELTGNFETGLFLDRASTAATVTRAVVSKTQVRASTGAQGVGVLAQRGASLTATQLVVEDSHAAGVVVTTAPSTATLTDCFVRRTVLGVDSTGAMHGIGVMVLGGASLTWTGGGAESAPEALLHVQDMGSSATVHHFTASHDTPMTQVVRASGIDAESSATVTLDHVAVVDVKGSAVFSTVLGDMTLDHVTLRDVDVGVRAQGGRVTATALEVRGHADVGLMSLDQGSLDVGRCAVLDGTADGAFGVASEASLATVARCVVDGSVTAGVYAMSGGTALVSDSVVRGTRVNAAGEFGQGAIVEAASSVTLSDVTLTENHSAGLQVSDARSSLTAIRCVVRATQPQASGTRGRAANAQFGGALLVTGSAFVDNQQVGVFAFQSRVELTDSVVRGMRPDRDGSYGNGLEALTDGVIVFTRGALEGSAGIAAVFAEGAGVLDGTRVANNSIGLHAQDGSVVDELASVPASVGDRQVVVTSATTFEGNQAKLSATTVPVPAL